jgi:CDP-diacylglycerol--glycerol-3-phosphate 3-phosphatidyltransferase
MTRAANLLTLGRLAIAIIIFPMLILFPPGAWLVLPLALLVVAGVTDILDGVVARRTNSQSEFGRVADAFIDRVLACGCYVVFLAWGLVDTWVVLVVVVREFLVGGMRNLADAHGMRFKATVFGKTKFASQFAACMAVIAYRALFEPAAWARVAMDVIVYVSAVNTLLSGLIYLANYRKLVGDDETP